MNGSFNATIEYLETVGSTNDYLRKRVEADGAMALGDGYTVIADHQTSGKGRLGRSFYSPAGSGLYMSILLKPENCPAERAMKFTTMAAVAACEAIEEVTAGIYGNNFEGSEAETAEGNLITPECKRSEAMQKAPQIKWVNDIYMSGKKVCGILTEAVFKSCSELTVGKEGNSSEGCGGTNSNVSIPTLDYAILGVGFNVFAPSEKMPDEIADIAGFIFEYGGNCGSVKKNLAEAFLDRFARYYAEGAEYMEEYRRRSVVIGKEILIYKAGDAPAGLGVRVQTEAGTEQSGSAATMHGVEKACDAANAAKDRKPEGRLAVAIGIDNDGGLIVRYEDGTEATLTSGEISIRLK